MIRMVAIALACMASVSGLRADEALNRKGIEEIVAAAAHQPREQRIESLGLALRRLSSASLFPDREKIRGLQEEVRQQFVSIPGYADYFGDKLRNHEARLLAGKGNLNAFDRDRSAAFEALQFSKSKDAVRMLMSFIDDDLGGPEALFPHQQPDDDAPLSPTSYLVVRTLGGMGLENAVRNSETEVTYLEGGTEKHDTREFIKMDVDRPKWKQWWADVCSGATVCRFTDTGAGSVKFDVTWRPFRDGKVSLCIRNTGDEDVILLDGHSGWLLGSATYLQDGADQKPQHVGAGNFQAAGKTTMIPLGRPTNGPNGLTYSTFDAGLEFGKPPGTYSEVECRFHYVVLSDLQGLKELPDLAGKARQWEGPAREDNSPEPRTFPR